MPIMAWSVVGHEHVMNNLLHIIFQQNLTGQVGQCNLVHVYIIIQVQSELQGPI